jgi:VWFA-related protein
LAAGVAAACGFSLGAPVHGQQPSSQFGARVDLVRVDVSVIDKNHQPVRGLTQADFTILEDDTPQAIQTFVAVDLADDPPQPPGWMLDVAPDVTSNTGVEEDRLVVIVMDDYAKDVKEDLWAMRSAKEIGRGVVERLGPRDLAAVVYTVVSRNNQEFTHDRARLLAAVDRFAPARNLPEQMAAIQMLQHVCEVLGSVAERRKVLVWVTPGVIPPGSGPFVAAAQLANVNIFPIDPAGIRVPDIDASLPDAGIGSTSADRMNSWTRLSAQRDVLFGIASQTGGRAFQRNEFETSLNQVFRETGSFYLLGYVVSNTTADGKFRRLQVKVNRKDATVNARTGRWAPPSPEMLRRFPPPPPPTPAVDALIGLVPVRGVPLRLTAVPFSTPENPVAIVALGVPAMPDAADDVEGVLDAFTFDGVLKQSVKLEGRLAANVPGDVLARVDLAPGRYQLRVALTSARRGASGSVYADLDVPNFALEPLSLSGVVVAPPPATSPAGASAAALFPTTTRTFARASSVRAFVTIYQGRRVTAQPVAVDLTIRNEADAVVVHQDATFEAARFETAARGVDYPVTLALAPLPPGEYLLTFDARAGKATARRDVRFSVR